MTVKERARAPLEKAATHPATTRPQPAKPRSSPPMAAARLPTPLVASVILEGAGRVAPAAARTRPPTPKRDEHAAPTRIAAPVATEHPDSEKTAKPPRPRASRTKSSAAHPAPEPEGAHGSGKEAPGKEAPGGGGADGAAGGAASGGASGGVRMHMPAPPSHASAATVGRIKRVQARAGAAAAAQATLPDSGEQTADARKAVTEPDAEATAKAQADLITELGEQPKPSPEIEALCERIRKVIRDKRPPDEDALASADPEAAANDAGNQLNSSVQGDTQKVQGSYDSINSPPAAAAPAKGAELPPAPAAAPTAPVNAASATPDSVPAKNVSLDADAADSKAKMQQAGMDKPTAQLVQSGPIAEARSAQGELEQTAKEDPAKVLAAQQQTLGKAQADMAALQQQALAALHAERAGTVKKTTSQQHGMVGSEESMRTDASERAKTIFTETQSQVTELLKPLASNAMSEWDAAKTVLTSKFKADLADVQRRVDDRHSGASGFVVGLWDAVTGLPSWAERDYSAAEKNFGDGVCERMKQISVKVNTVIAACDALIKSARTRIAKIFADLPAGLQEWAKQEQGKFDGRLDALHDQAMAARNSFNKDMVKDASEAVQAVREEVAELRKKAGGLLGRIADAVGRFLDDPVKFIIDGLLELVGIPAASFWALVNKIKKVISDIADDPMKFANNLMDGLGKGFMQFFDNIGTHLFKGFISWLTGGLVGGGVQLPKDFSLRSIITFLLQLMGITWPRIRKILAKHLGEKNVALAEKVYSMVSLLIEKGPEGIYEMIKEKLDPQSLVDQVVQMAVDYMIGAIMKAAAARIVLLFNPVGAIFQALEAIYRVLKWIFQNAARIFALVETVVNGIADILAGNLGGFANAVEKALGMLIAPVISFIADYLGFGDLPSVIADKVKSFQEWILGLIEQALVWLIEKGKKLLAAVGIGKKEKGEKGPYDGQIGKKVHWRAEDESHDLWLDEHGGEPEVMMASGSPGPVKKKLADYATQAKALTKTSDKERRERAETAITSATEELAETKKAATGAKQAQTAGDDKKAELKAKDDETESWEDKLWPHLQTIQIALRLIEIPKTDVSPTSGSKASHVRAEPLTKKAGNTTGSRPSGTLKGWDHVMQIDHELLNPKKGHWGPAYWVAAHLLSEKLHGPGKPWNTVPALKTDNAAMESGVESDAKRKIGEDEVLYYDASVTYYSGEICEDFPQSLTIEWGTMRNTGKNKWAVGDAYPTFAREFAPPPLEVGLGADINRVGRVGLMKRGVPIRLAMAIDSEKGAGGPFKNQDDMYARLLASYQSRTRALTKKEFDNELWSVIADRIADGKLRVGEA